MGIANAVPDEVVEWTEGLVLILDNHRILHRRPEVTMHGRILERTYIWGTDV
jgi:alpha-ketoglutarate-dependent taurine dioxygenase